MVIQELAAEPQHRVLAREKLFLELRGLGRDLRRLANLLRLGPGDLVRPQLEQPVAQQPRRLAVLRVVLLDLMEQRVVARLEPLLVHEDRVAAGLELGFARHEERLDVLERVPGMRVAQPLADDLEEVDEDAGAQEVVDLVLARAVPAHQPLERGRLVARVVVDVQARVARASLVDEVDEVLERLLLGGAVVRPEGAVALGVADAPEVLEPAARLPERVALDVEEEIAGRGRRQEREPARRLRRQHAVDVLAGARMVELELGLPAQRVEGRGRHSGRAVVLVGFGQLGERRDVDRGEPGDLVAADVRDATRMVIALPLRLAELLEVAERAMRDGHRVGVEPGLDRGDEPIADAAVVGGEVVEPERVALAGAEHDVHQLGLAPLDAGDLLAVEAELEDVTRLRVPRELGVRDLVAAAGLPLEKVGVAGPAGGIEEDGLVDDLGAVPHRLLSTRGGGLGVPFAVGPGDLDRDDLLPGRAKLVEVRALVLLTLAPDQLSLRIVPLRPSELTASNLKLECNEVLALEEVVHVGWRKPQFAVHGMHTYVSRASG